MVEYIVESDIAKKYLEWCWDTGHPSEHYWNTLNYNTHVAAPGGYIGTKYKWTDLLIHLISIFVCVCVSELYLYPDIYLLKYIAE